MNIDIKKAQEKFIEYTQNYNLENEHIKGKQEHSIRVMNISKQIAEGLRLSKEDVDIATLIGLLHDIARFEQYTKYSTFEDLASIDHGDYGVQILDNDIRKYIETDEYDEIIKLAVKNHNKYKIEEGLTEKEQLFAKIIRDADKIDIFHESVNMFWKGKEEEVNNSKISQSILEQFENRTQIKREKGKVIENLEEVVSVIAFIFDMNFKASFEILKEEDYVNKILNRYDIKNEDSKKAVEEIRKIANEYIGKKRTDPFSY